MNVTISFVNERPELYDIQCVLFRSLTAACILKNGSTLFSVQYKKNPEDQLKFGNSEHHKFASNEKV